MESSSLKSYIGHRAREMAVWASVVSRFGQNGAGRILFLPSQAKDIGSSKLRVYDIAAEMKKLGWNTQIIPKQLELSQRRRIIKLFNPNYIFMQLTRHELNRAEYYLGRKLIFDIDDPDYLDERQTEHIVRACRGAALVVAGSRNIERWCRQYSGNVEVIWTGSPPTPTPPADSAQRECVVAWAAGYPHLYPLEAALVFDIATAVKQRIRNVVFRLYGWNGGPAMEAYAAQFMSAGIKIEKVPYLPYEAFLSSLRDVAVGLHPIHPDFAASQGKSFGKLLAYMDAGVAVVTSAAADHALFYESGRNAMLVTEKNEWVDAICMLLERPDMRASMAKEAYADFLKRLTTEAAARRLHHILNKFAGQTAAALSDV
ncbi:glycosyltransferase family protein [Hyphococcus sp.]|uniref:glycosyltransferase family protein n=1 Tax=Hyphococcus sp. TaxID=2038636 RepID=UPI00207DF70C|nr:MAG: hypothetical protein DHS20C04_22580 [Marinicaulis sp.]